MDKQELLEYLDSNDCATAEDLASTVDMSYSATAMALVRLVRQDLAARYKDPETQLYIYELTPKGEVRLDYLLESEFDDC